MLLLSLNFKAVTYLLVTHFLYFFRFNDEPHIHITGWQPNRDN